MNFLNELYPDSPAPALTDPALQRAELLILLLHRGVDWNIWGGHRRNRYWDALTDRIRAGTYAGPTLSHWWSTTSEQLGSAPRSPEDRALVAQLLFTDDSVNSDVLKALRDHASVLVLRIRVHIESAKEDA